MAFLGAAQPLGPFKQGSSAGSRARKARGLNKVGTPELKVIC